jgi:hypothetical protein
MVLDEVWKFFWSPVTEAIWIVDEIIKRIPYTLLFVIGIPWASPLASSPGRRPARQRMHAGNDGITAGCASEHPLITQPSAS